MFCTKCGKSMLPGDEFCPYCGTPARTEEQESVQARTTPTQPLPAAAPLPQREKKGVAAFFSSPAGIVVIVLIALCVIAAVVVPVVLLTTGESETTGKSDAGFKKDLEAAWEEFQDCTAKMDPLLESVADLNTVNADSLKSFVSEIKDGIVDVKEELADLTPPDKYESNYEHLLQATKDYESYLGKLESFITIHAANTSDPQLDGLLTDMTNLASAVKIHVEGFLKYNDVVEASGFDPAILALPPEYAAQLATIRQVKEQEAAAAKAAEEQKAAEQAAAAAAAEAKKQAQYVTCPLCDGAGTIEGGDARYTCPFCNGSGSVTRSKAATYNPSDWIP
ncbi:MAG: zinc-ribbon domain-containing protein [Sedimentisphaerales bacterium]|nr:zinc-ribbon domain-containing protein [Sedimentisphaerales bacterium]